MRPDLFVHRLIERVGLRKQYLFSDRTESLERLVNIAKFAELAAAWVRREPGRRSRDFAEYIAAVAAAGLREEEATVRGRPGLRAGHDDARREGARVRLRVRARRAAEPDAGPPARRRDGPRGAAEGGAARGTREAHIAEMRRLLYVAMTRARRRLVLAWPECTGRRRRAGAAEAVAVLRGGARGGGRRGGRAPRRAARDPRGPATRPSG